MAFYLHIGGELNGRMDSTTLIDRWIHNRSLQSRLRIMELVFEL